MDVIFWLLAAFVMYKMLMPSAPPPSEGEETQEEERHLTETQRRWRQMKRETELEKLAGDGNDYATKYEQIIKLQVDMRQYILENKRQFHPLVWMFDTIDSRLCGEYIRHVAIMFGIFLMFTLFVGWSTMLLLVLGFNVFMVDFMIYRKQLMLEVTAWNPEFQEKYAKKFENLTRGMDIP